MSDFQDCLRHQIAHVVIGEFKSGQFEAAQQLYAEAIATYDHGFQKAYLLREPGSDRGISIIFWDSIDEMDEQQHKVTHQEILRKMGPLFQAIPNSGVYELASCLVAPERTGE